MNRTLVLFTLMAACVSATAQEDVFDSGLPKSKQAMLVLDVSPTKILKNPLVSPFLTPEALNDFLGPVDAKRFLNIESLTMFIGVPDIRSPDFDFVARIKLEDKTKIPETLKALFGREELKSREEDGWTILEPVRRFPGFPEVIRHRENMLEFGSSLYTFTPSRSLASKSLANSFSALDKEADFRIAFDAQVLSKFAESSVEFRGCETRCSLLHDPMGRIGERGIDHTLRHQIVKGITNGKSFGEFDR